ncbi:MAG: carboxypeptidase regulatory-like domain-containing protein, partial [Vicingaceae bacterium]|nr:carboxypeptidase regulatory-like domain-containing protein [Vicingaceae bacterium]
KKLTTLVLVLFAVSIAVAQSGGSIKGKMLDKDNGEPLPFANIILMKGGAQVAGTTTDFDGKFTFSALTPGKYDLQAIYVGYQKVAVSSVSVSGGKITFVPDIKAASSAENIEEFVVIEYKVPLISKDQTSSGGTITAEDIKKMPGRSAASIAATVGGVYSQDDGSTNLNVRGARSSSTDTYIDGIKVRGTQNLPNSAIEQVSVVTGGIPAQFGDVTGGVVNITTKGATKNWFGGIEYLTSGFKTGDNVVGLDNYGFNLFGFSVSGPLKTKKDSTGRKTDAVAGFFLSGELKHEVDPRPYSGGVVRLGDEMMDSLNARPYIQNLTEAGGVINSANFLRESDLERSDFRLNAGRKSMNLAGKIDLTTSKTTSVAIGGSFDYRDANGYSRGGSLLNYQNNSQVIDNTWRVYARFTQRFANSTDEENPSLIKDAFISFQADYSQFTQTQQSKKHKDNFSHYGYVGKFTSQRDQVYNNGTFRPTVNGEETGEVFAGLLSDSTTVFYDFEASDINPILSNYTANYYEVFQNDIEGNIDNIISVQGNGGLVNGDRPLSVYSLWTSMGAPFNGYSKTQNSQFRVTGQGSATIKDHAIQIGFEYEQNNDRRYAVNNPAGLWTYGRGLVNTHVSENDFERGNYDSTLVSTSNGGLNQYTFVRQYNGESHNTFDKNLRTSLGLNEQGLDFIDFDAYGEDSWDIGMFSPDELINGGGFVSTNGYDYKGDKLSGSSSLDDFFNKVDDRGDKLRESPAFTPIYMAGYIQDKFAFEDLIFNVGIRIDRYDANQSVLKDKYSLFPTKTLADISDDIATASDVVIPDNIGDDFVVYVSESINPDVNSIVGFRDGDTWYNAAGEEISDPKVLDANGIPQPWLVNPSENNVFDHLSSESFKDYEPQVNISPRIAFSFPISDEALFFAHYDVLTQRPSGGVNRLNLISYLAFEQGTGGTDLNNNIFNNPDLRAEKTIDYELGFQQKIDNYSALKISGFYREQRDQVQVASVLGAFPGDYRTYDNKDFGTVKGMTISYDLRARRNLTLRASYTLQFADGTGSSTTTSNALVAGGFGNLRTLAPLDFDQRHNILVSADYRYSSGKNYNGPVMFGKNIFQNMGANLIMRSGSGRPYTKTSRADGGETLFASNGTSPQQGQLNSSRLPFATTFDFKIDRNFDIKFGKEKEDGNRKEASLNVYIQVLNLLDAKNIIFVYPFTGNATDDGFLAASYQQTFIEQNLDQQSFRDLYSAKIDDGSNFALPRRIRLGIQLNF